MSSIKSVSINGPESSGKTTLAELLSARLDAYLVEEQSRIYFREKRMERYDAEDVYRMAEMQIEAEKAGVASGKEWVFSDTDVFTFIVWLNWKKWDVPPFIQQWLNHKPYHLILLCTPDLPWAFDPLRENPDEGERKLLFSHYLELIQSSGMPYGIVNGSGEDRVETALTHLRTLL